jgi:hypothetical protein
MRLNPYVCAAVMGAVVLMRTPASADLPAGLAAPSPAALFQKFCADEEALFKAKVAFIESKLRLRPDQQPSWTTFVSEAAAAGQSIRVVCKQSQPGTEGDVVSDLDFHQRTLGAFLETHLGLTTAAKKLVGALTPEQQRVLADSILHPLPPVPPFPAPLPPL